MFLYKAWKKFCSRLRAAAQRPLINGDLATPKTHGRSRLRAAVKLFPDLNQTKQQRASRFLAGNNNNNNNKGKKAGGSGPPASLSSIADMLEPASSKSSNSQQSCDKSSASQPKEHLSSLKV